jgi:hypothetical protein
MLKEYICLWMWARLLARINYVYIYTFYTDSEVLTNTNYKKYKYICLGWQRHIYHGLNTTPM